MIEKKYHPIQLTFENCGHTLHHYKIESFDSKFLTFDLRNDDTKISETSKIGILNIITKEEKIIYETKNQTKFGPGVGAASFSSIANKVIFIHGIRNSNQLNPYSPTRRTGVVIDLELPNELRFMDARNILSPYTDGALRGGTHSHSWKNDKNWISFTYNDFVIETESKRNTLIKDQRVIGMMFPKKVEVDESLENNSGEMFSVIVSKVVLFPKKGSDEIEKAFDECWINNSNNIAFQGHVRDVNGQLKTEVFVAHLPDEINISENDNLKGTSITLPDVPECISQERITFTDKGISTFRHWLRSSNDGKMIYFLKENKSNITQLFGVDLDSKEIMQFSFLKESINSPFNLSFDNKYAVFYSNQKIILLSLIHQKTKILYDASLTEMELTGIPHFSNDGTKIYFNQFVLHNSGEKNIQIFELKLNVE